TQADAIGAIAKYADLCPIPIMVDEVPIKSNDPISDRLVSFVVDLLEGAKRSVGSHVRFLICSINPPAMSRQPARTSERIKVLELKMWEDADITNLIKIVQGSELPISLQDADVKKLLLAAA